MPAPASDPAVLCRECGKRLRFTEGVRSGRRHVRKHQHATTGRPCIGHRFSDHQPAPLLEPR